MTNTNFTPISSYQEDNIFLDSLLKIESERLKPSIKLLDQMESPYTVALYIRVSTPGQMTPDKVSPEQQHSELMSLATKRGWLVMGTYTEEGVSGKFMDNREAFKRMMKDVYEKKIDIIASWANDRVARNATEMAVLRNELWKHKVQFTSVCEPEEVKPKKELFGRQSVMEKLYKYMLDWKSEQDNETRTKRFELGKRGKANRGQIPGKAPYGYCLWFESLPGPRLRRVQHVDINPAQAVIVKDIFNFYDKELFGVRKIAETLNLRGTPAPKGTIWGASTVKYILNNPTYTGFVRYGWRLSNSVQSLERITAGHQGIIVRGTHEALIDQDTFKRVNDRLKRRAQMGGRAVHSKGLLSGLLKCPRCGGKTYLSSYYNSYTYQKVPENERKKHKLTEAYFCSRYAQYGHSGCQKGYIISRNKIERVVIALISQMASDEGVKEKYVKEMRKSNKDELLAKRAMLIDERNTIPSTRSKLFVLLQHDKITNDEFNSERQRLEQEETSLMRRIDEVNQSLVNSEKIESQTESAIMALGDFETAWSNASVQAKKEIISAIVGKVTYKNQEVFVEFRIEN